MGVQSARCFSLDYSDLLFRNGVVLSGLVARYGRLVLLGCCGWLAVGRSVLRLAELFAL